MVKKENKRKKMDDSAAAAAASASDVVDNENNKKTTTVKKQKNTSSSSTEEERETKLLSFMMQNLIRGCEAVSFRKCAADMGFMERTKTQRDAWKALLDKKFIEPCGAEGSAVYTSDHKVTEKGKELGSTPEYQEYLKELKFVATTNEEHQERIKKKLKNKQGIRIFDLLLEHGSLTRKELAGIIGINDRSHAFSYALKQLKQELKHVEQDPTAGTKGKLRLADKAYLSGQQPEEREVTKQDLIDKLIGATGKKAKRKVPKKEEGSTGEKKAKAIEADQEESSPKDGDKEEVKKEVREEKKEPDSSESSQNKEVQEQEQ